MLSPWRCHASVFVSLWVSMWGLLLYPSSLVWTKPSLSLTFSVVIWRKGKNRCQELPIFSELQCAAAYVLLYRSTEQIMSSGAVWAEVPVVTLHPDHCTKGESSYTPWMTAEVLRKYRGVLCQYVFVCTATTQGSTPLTKGWILTHWMLTLLPRIRTSPRSQPVFTYPGGNVLSWVGGKRRNKDLSINVLSFRSNKGQLPTGAELINTLLWEFSS